MCINAFFNVLLKCYAGPLRNGTVMLREVFLFTSCVQRGSKRSLESARAVGIIASNTKKTQNKNTIVRYSEAKSF